MQGAVADAVGRTLTELRYTPFVDFEDPHVLWLSDAELLYSTTRQFPAALNLGFKLPAIDALNRRWSLARRGSVSTAEILRSRSREISPTPAEGSLVVADARTGSGRLVAEGLFTRLSVSASGRFVAGMRRNGLRTTAPSEFTPLMSSSDLHVIELTPNDAGRVIRACAECEVASETTTWHHDRDALFFFARPTGHGWRDGSYFRLELPSGELVRLDIGAPLDLNSPRSDASLSKDSVVRPVVPVGDGVALLVASAQRDGTDHAEWVYYEEGLEPRRISDPVPDSMPVLLARSSSCLWALGRGDVWRYCIDKMPQNLTVGYPLVLRSLEGAPARSHILLEARDRDSRVVLAHDLDTGAFSTLAHLDRSENVLDAWRGSMSVLAIRSDGAGLELSEVRGVTRRRVVRLNEFLASVAWPDVERVSYAYRGVSLGACVYLHRELDPSKAPVVAWLYPEIASRDDCSESRDGAPAVGPGLALRLGQLGLDTPQYLASLGYTVVVPATPRDLLNSAAEAGAHYSELVNAAIDAVAKARLGDGARVGLFGFSQGGYSVLKTLTQSHYRAAVAGFSASDYASHYADFGTVRGVLDSIWAPGMSDWYPGNGLRSRARPWDDPDWFIRSSPYFHARNISTPLLMVQSDLDEGFPMSQFNELFTALYLERRDVDYVRYWGEAHSLSSPANVLDLDIRIREWLLQYLGRPGAPSTDPS